MYTVFLGTVEYSTYLTHHQASLCSALPLLAMFEDLSSHLGGFPRFYCECHICSPFIVCATKEGVVLSEISNGVHIDHVDHVAE